MGREEIELKETPFPFSLKELGIKILQWKDFHGYFK